MKFTGFEKLDFDLFLEEDFEERMGVLKEQLRPKFYNLGEDLKSALSSITGDEMFVHVAKHARRKTNPPNDSWFALASNKRGYKMMPHFQVAVWKSHVLVQWGIIYEAKNKEVFANNLVEHLDEVRKNIPENYQWFKDHMKPQGTIQSSMTDEDFKEFARRLKENKNGEVMVGLVISKDEALKMDPEGFFETVIETWSNLDYLHKLAH